MKPAAEMTEAEKAQTRAWLRNWETLGPILEEVRRQAIRKAQTAAAIAAFED